MRISSLSSGISAVLLAAGLAIAPAAAAKPSAKPGVSMEERIGTLQPGHWVWRPELAPEGEVALVVSLPLQRAYVYRGGKLIGGTTVSTGMAGYDTPAGDYRVLQKREKHESNIYDSAPMPFMQRLTWDGIALHGGSIPGGPASHGCVRLPRTFASKLYGVTDLGARVLIVDESPDPDAALAMLDGNMPEVAMGGPEEAVEDEVAR